MAALSKRLQIQGSRPHRPQQSLSLHRYKKPELQTSPLGSKALLLPLLYQLLIRQGQWKCKCSIAILSAKCRKRSYPLGRKHQNPAPAVVLPGQHFWPFLRRVFPLLLDPRLWHYCSAFVAALLGLLPKRDSQWVPLQCQYRSHETKTSDL